jgi:hypothetical protein
LTISIGPKPPGNQGLVIQDPLVERAKMTSDRMYLLLTPYFRKKRMRHFLNRLKPGYDSKILDVGGTIRNWELIDTPFSIEILNLSLPEVLPSDNPRIKFVEGDGTDLHYRDHSFDICFSNSVIEHLGSYENQKKYAFEVSRVAEAVWIQTPARSFPLEPHFLFPFIQFIPNAWKKRIARYFTPWGWITRPSAEEVNAFVDEIRLLTYEEMQNLFPDCEIHVERFLGMPKAYIAIRDG